MSYILSLLNSKSPDRATNQESPFMLCYYINDTVDTQIIRLVGESAYYFERIVFPKERILFEALLESYLEVCSPFQDGTRTTRSECRLFQINEK